MITIFDRREGMWFLCGGEGLFPKNLFISWAQVGGDRGMGDMSAHFFTPGGQTMV